MRKKKYFILALVFFAASPTLFAKGTEEKSLSFWNMPFVTQEVSPDYVKQWTADVKTALPEYSVGTFFGPGDYGKLRTTYLVQAASGSPDVIEGLLEDTAVYVEKGVIEPLDSYFEAWPDKDLFVESTLAPLTINGHLYGIPYNTNARGLIYRKDIFQKYGLKVPQTWEELINTAREITRQSDKQMYGLFLCTKVGDPRAPQEFISWYFQVSGGKPMFTVSGGNKTFNATVEQFEKILTLYGEAFFGDTPAVNPDERGNGWPSEDPGYASGKWAMAPEGPWLWGRRSGDPTAAQILDNSVVVELPHANGVVPATYLEVKPIMMNHYSKDKPGAWELIKFITSKQEMAGWDASSGGIPARRDALDLPVFQGPLGNWIKMFAALLSQAHAQEPVNWGPVSDAEMRAVNYVIYSQKSPREAAQYLYDTIQGLMQSGQI